MCVGSRLDLDLLKNVYTGAICDLLITAFRQATVTNGLAAMMIFSTIWLGDTGLILVINEIDEEYCQDCIDRCIWIHP